MLGMRVGSPHPVPWRNSQVTSSSAIKRCLLITNVCWSRDTDPPNTTVQPSPPHGGLTILHIQWALLSVSHIPSYLWWWSFFFFNPHWSWHNLITSWCSLTQSTCNNNNKIRKQHRYYWMFYNGEKDKIYISLCKANSLQFPHQTSIFLFHSSWVNIIQINNIKLFFEAKFLSVWIMDFHLLHKLF